MKSSGRKGVKYDILIIMKKTKTKTKSKTKTNTETKTKTKRLGSGLMAMLLGVIGVKMGIH